MTKLEQAFQLFDAYNQQDSHTFIWQGVSFRQEYFMALRLYEWVLKLNPEANDELLLASRSQHIGRWEIPRNTYPAGKAGYLTWRKELGKFHAKTAGNLMAQVGYDTAQIARVGQIITKQKIKQDTDVQTIENALCLVFLQFQYEDFHTKHEPEKVIEILKKSLLKMDAHGHSFALQLDYSAKGLGYIQEALKLL
ncbi:DUF4202 domain-containing protein [Flectobacillus major]|uniref:DUF4202 domain-containing protein n=1 Tax=Flectobacillus major TaxID=103 RepID=UPI0004095D95|nr:DUF4202 domain-containing protein [Flectobacillus major]